METGKLRPNHDNFSFSYVTDHVITL